MRRRRVARAVALGVLGVLGLAACTPNASSPRETIPHFAESGGQVLSEFVATIDSIDGLSVERASLSDLPNIKGNTGFDMRLVLDADYVIADPVAFANYLVLSAWSVRDGYMPNIDMSFSIVVEPYDSFWFAEAMYDAGWLDAAPQNTLAPNTSNLVRVSVSPTDAQGAINLERLGPWPGDAPALPANLTAPN